MTSSESTVPATALRARLGAAAGAIAETLRCPQLRRAQLSYGAVLAGEWAFMVALAVVAFRHGGAGAVGLMTVALMGPAALLVPLGAALSDRLARERVLVGAGLGCALTIAAVAVSVAVGAPPALTLAFAIAANISLFAIRPAHSALLPALCRTPRQLTNATVVRGLMDSLGGARRPGRRRRRARAREPAGRPRGRRRGVRVVGAADRARALRGAAAHRGRPPPPRARGRRGRRRARAPP